MRSYSCVSFTFPFNLNFHNVMLEYVVATYISTSCLKIYVHTLWKLRNRKNWEISVNELQLMVVRLLPLSLLMLLFAHITVLRTLRMNLSLFVVLKGKLKLLWISIFCCLMPFSQMELRLECILGSIVIYTTICSHSVHLEVQLMLIPTKAFMF